MRNIQTQKTLFHTLVQSILEYCSIVWLPFYDIHRNKIECILRQFSMFALREYPNAGNNYRISGYDERLVKLGMVSLNRRRINMAITFMFDLIHKNVHCPLLYKELEINRNARNLRQSELIIIKDLALRLSLSSPTAQMCKFSNKVSTLLSSNIARSTFKTKISCISNEALCI